MISKRRKKEIDENSGLGAKVMSYKRNVYLGRIAIAALVIGGVIFFFMNWNHKTYTTYEVKSSIERLGSSDAWYLPLNEKILIYSKDGISCIDAKGKALWNQTYGMQKPMVVTSGDMVAVGDYNGNRIYVIDETGNAEEIQTNLPIKKLTVSEKGIVASILDDGDVTWIYVYDKMGNQLAFEKSTMKITGYPIDIDFSGELLGASYLYVDSGTLKTNITFYNFGDVGQNSLDKIVSSYTYADTIVPQVSFMNEETAFAVADNRIMFYSGSQKPVHQAERLIDKEIQDIYYGKEYVALVFYDETGQYQYQIDLFDESGKMIRTVYCDMDYKTMLFENDCLIIYNEAECLIYDVDGTKKYGGAFMDEIYAMIPQGSINKYVLVTNHSIETIKLQ